MKNRTYHAVAVKDIDWEKLAQRSLDRRAIEVTANRGDGRAIEVTGQSR